MYKRITRHRKTIELTLSTTSISFEECRNLNGLFERYSLKDKKQLKKLFKTERNKE